MTNPNSSQQTNNQQKGDGGNSGQNGGQTPVSKKQTKQKQPQNKGANKQNLQQNKPQNKHNQQVTQPNKNSQPVKKNNTPPQKENTSTQNPFATTPKKENKISKTAPKKQNLQKNKKPQNKPKQQTLPPKENSPKQNPFQNPHKKENKQPAKPEPQNTPEKKITSDEKIQTETTDKEIVVKSNPFETPAKEETKVTVKPKDEPIAKENEDELDELLDEDSLIDDGDSIWIIQRIIFSVLKTSSVIIIIIIVIWLIWDPDGNPLKKFQSNSPSLKTVEPAPKTPSQNPTNQPVYVPKDTPKTSIKEINNPIIESTKLNLFIENKRLSESQKLIEKSLTWCREGAAIFDMKMAEYFSNKSRDQRVQTFKNLLISIDTLQAESKTLSLSLTLENQGFTKKMNKADAEVQKYSAMFLESVKGYDPVNANEILNKKIIAEQDYFKHKNNIRARELVLEKINKITNDLSQYREIMIANQKAIEADIQVVDFPADPFNKILTPDEWRTFQENKKN